MKTNIKIIKNAEKPEPTEILAEAVIRISDGLEKMQKSGLNQRAIIALIKDNTGLGKTEIELVINSLARLKGWYCR